mmetsp:Transcript_8299/g.37076  ORF Transcript_8299/g.37076 Transcript_8299/m.37076 type:complete len:116 (+) Transcript_8299:180-527(+)
MGSRVQKIMTQPINVIFRYLQSKSPVQIWLYDETTIRIEGVIIGFDEYMNLVLDNAVEVNLKKNTYVFLDPSSIPCWSQKKKKKNLTPCSSYRRKNLGRILLKGDTITLMTAVKG